MRVYRIAAAFLCLLVIEASSRGLCAQDRTIRGAYDDRVSFPRAAKTLGEKDPKAVELIELYLNASGSNPWMGLSGEGSIYVGSTAKPEPRSASLVVDQDGRVRLDVTDPTGTQSTRINGAVGGIVQVDGAVHHFTAQTAAMNLFMTPIMLAASLKDAGASLIDDGIVVEGGVTLRQITYTRAFRPGTDRVQSTLVAPLVTSLFFEPVTHMLVKTVEGFYPSGTSRVKRLRVITFSDYRQLEHSLVPYTYMETLDGAMAYQLSLTAAKLTCSHGADYFDLTGGGR